ncbi:hypothetical protein BDN70DRAFT_996036 [Pholiota conissans]|uniref:MYND-type domain-containing protein n=1 Tax=Pholiota conissans TaxID=109636 RepID=A0A9P5YXU2_9AGAR|nr:hypothetical protein BDN70DRAFT_996036 [Pholiota conissans]
MESSKPIYVFDGIVHPDRKAVFREDAPPKSMVKEGRKEAIRACTKCGKADENGVKKCAKCGLTFYCSEECQREHWPIHKPNCSSEYGNGIQSLIKSVTGNPMISHYIQVCLSLKFGFHHLRSMSPSKRETVLRAPLSVHIDVGIEPTKIGDFMALYTYPEEWDKDELEGMLQFHHLSGPKDWVPERRLTDSEIAMWRQARQSADEDGEKNYPVVMVQFVNNFKQRITCTFTVDDEAMGQARRGIPFTVGSAITGKLTDKPLTIPNCFEYLNTHIRADKKNQLLLRAPMRLCDKELIRDAGRNAPGHAAQMLLLKMKHEGVYVSYSSEFVAEAAAARAAGAEARNNARANAEAQEGEDEVEVGAGQAPEPPKPPMNRAERRRLEREMKKEAKRRK